MFAGTLLPYQPGAVDRICERKKILVAYDLGLGKTVIAIAAIERMFDDGTITEPGLVVCPSTLKYQWAAQVHKFTGGTSRALVIDGTPKKRAEQYAQAIDWRASGVDYVVLNYEQVVRDWKQVQRLPRGFVVMDEATAIKSFRSKRSKAVKRLDSPVKIALTGTPIDNGKPEELFSIMQAVDPGVLGRFDLFDQAFIVRGPWGNPERYRNLPLLHDTVMQAAIRKGQDDPDVRPHLPDRIIPDPIYVRLDRNGRALYGRIADDLLLDLDEVVQTFGSSFNIFAHYGVSGDQGGPMDRLRGQLMSKIMCLRMLCDHPALLRTSAQHDPIRKTGSAYAAELLADGALDGLANSPKLSALGSLLGDFLDQDPRHKAVVFTSFVEMASLIRESLPRIGSVAYTGRLDAREKERSKVQFQEDPKTRLFVSSDAGGYGVDLPQASLLVNYDLPWSAGLSVQRNGRIRRALSPWPSIVIQDLLVMGSIEERQREVLDDKNAVAAAIMRGEGIDAQGGVSMSAGSLRSFLKTAAV